MHWNVLTKLLPLNNLPKDSVLAIQMRRRDRGDKELRSVAAPYKVNRCSNKQNGPRSASHTKRTHVFGPEFAIERRYGLSCLS